MKEKEPVSSNTKQFTLRVLAPTSPLSAAAAMPQNLAESVVQPVPDGSASAIGGRDTITVGSAMPDGAVDATTAGATTPAGEVNALTDNITAGTAMPVGRWTRARVIAWEAASPATPSPTVAAAAGCPPSARVADFGAMHAVQCC